MTKFWELMGGKLAERCAALWSAALVFWGGVFAVGAYATDGRLAGVVEHAGGQPAIAQVGLIIAALVVVGGSALVVRRLTSPALSLLRGPWRGPLLWWLSRSLESRFDRKAERWTGEWQRLSKVIDDRPTLRERMDFTRLDDRLRRVPSIESGRLPTTVGNTFRAMDVLVEAKYGLVSHVVWPRLWLLLPEQARDELTAAGAGLDSAVSAAVWASAFVLFGLWTFQASLVGLLVLVLTVRFWVPMRAAAFADLVESAFDLHRMRLYDQLGLRSPASPAGEVAAGRTLTQYLYRGTIPAETTFTTKEDKGAS
jgi:hypothetical protein